MKFKTSASLMIALVLGIVTAYVGIDVVRKAKAGAGTGTKIVVAARDMEPGYVIEPSDLKMEEVSATLVPAKAFKDPKLVAGRTVLASVVRGYPLIDNQLAAAGSGAGMQAMVPRGMRAVAVEVSEGSAVAGLITPGCYVDVIATINSGEQPIATTVVQNVKVQFVQRTRPPRSNSNSQSPSAGTPELGPVKTVTLIVTPKQANALELATNQGKPRLVLRGIEDDTDTADATLKQNELLGIPDPPPPATQPMLAAAPAPDPPLIAPPAPPVEREMTDAFEDPEPLPLAPPAPNLRPAHIIRGGEEETIYFEENGDRAMEETPGSRREPPPRARQPRPTTRPQQPRKSSDPQQQQQQQQQPSPAQQPNGADGVNGDPRTASGVSPGDPAPRQEQGQKNLRKGM